jgi:dipeptidyl-peptidase-4
MTQRLCLSFFSAFALAGLCAPQSRLPNMPRFDRYQQARTNLFEAVKGGSVSVQWAPNGKSFQFLKEDKTVQYDIATKAIHEPKADSAPAAPAEEDPQSQLQNSRMPPGRGRQYTETYSPDGAYRAFYKDGNVHLEKLGGGGTADVTSTGSVASRKVFGTASWVYGEELEVREAMWFSPDSKKLAYYAFDDSHVPDYYVTTNLVDVQDKLEIEAYPKAGVTNPVVSVYLYDVATKQSTRVDTLFDDPAMGEYIYDIRWSPDGKELLFNRTNRQQNHLQLVAANRDSGACRVVVDENWSTTWNENHPPIRWLKEQAGKPRQFLFLSERNGYRNIYLGDITGAPLKPITRFNTFEVAAITDVDEARRLVFFTARDGDNPYKIQLHRVGFDGSGEKRLTDPKFNHEVKLAPDFKHFSDIEQNLTTPPKTLLVDDQGKVLDTLGTADASGFEKAGFKKAERIVFKAADGKTDLYGYVEFPSDFDPAKKYPLLVSLYAGPGSGSGSERFALPNPVTEFGFLWAWFDGRGTSGRGKAFADAVYRKLGTVEIDDQAAGVKYLASRPYVDGNRVGVYGTSYGGYASLMCLLRHPEAFAVAVSGSPVTDWRNYDSIYTERYMGLPTQNDNLKGYEAGSAARFAKDLKGRLMLYFGTADDNVHPSNMMQLVHALQAEEKSFDMMVGPDMGHSAINGGRQDEYFIDYLILHPDK